MALPPIIPVGIFLVILAFCSGIVALVPIITTWQWNKKQKEKRFT
ncbi:MAG TPA: hypothetical protein PL110_21400 [Candidatus Eremiobacteraeota bacterium]|nr:hypothetical protein [Candidatus Eremiobacteraeota bacterium]